MEVLKGEEDFYELAMAYYRRSHTSNVRYAEIMFDIQAHTRRGVSVATVMRGLERAKIEAERHLNVSSRQTEIVLSTSWFLFFLVIMVLSHILMCYRSNQLS